MQDGIQLPDPQARRSAALLVLIIAVLGAVAFVSIDRYVDSLTELAREDADQALQSLVYTLKVLAVGIGFLLVALAAWLFRLSMIVRKTERFPPPGTPVIRTTEVLTGKLARKKANMGYMLAALIAWAGVLGAWALWKITESFAAM